LAETNKADVERLNRAIPSRTFNPANHFSKPLSGFLLGKLTDVFAKHGSHLDISRPLTMAKVRAAVKAAKGKCSAGRPFGGVGHMSDDQLTLGNQSFRIEKHNGHDCIRIMVDRTRVRLRLDALEMVMGLLSQTNGSPDKSLPLSSIENRIGEVAPHAAGAPDADPLEDDLPENGPISPDLQESRPRPFLIGEVAPAPTEPPSLHERIAALKAAQTIPLSPACAEEVDPLML
jgi:hypothetical protein